MKVKLLLFFCLLFAASAHADSANFSAMLVKASNQPGATDKELSGIQGHLKQFPYKSYKFAGRGNKSVAVKSSGNFDVGGTAVSVKVNSITGNKVNASIQWKVGGKTAISTTLDINKGSGTIFGGPKSGDGALILYIKVK